MSTARVILDLGHNVPESNTPAWHDIDAAGMHALRAQERTPTEAWFAVCSTQLRAQDVEVLLLGNGKAQPYRSRWGQAAAWIKAYDKLTIYIQGHLNAGKHRSAYFFHDAASALGQECAMRIAEGYGECHLPGIRRSRAVPVWGDPFGKNERGFTDAAGRPAWRYRAFSPIAGLGKLTATRNICAVMALPACLDQPGHEVLLLGPGIQRVGMAMAQGIMHAVREVRL